MSCRTISFFICIVVAVVTANYTDPTTGHDSEITVTALRIDKSESSTVKPADEIKGTTGTDLGALLDAGDSTMVMLVAGDTKLVVHRAVLAVRSPVLAAMIRQDTLEASGSRVPIPDVEGPVLRQLVALLYTLEAPQQLHMSPQLEAAADRYGVSVVRAECRQQAATQLSVETAAATAVLAVRHSCLGLRQATIAFMKDHLVPVMATQAWADTVHNWPTYAVQITRLLSAAMAETSTPATGDSGATPTTQPHSDHRDRGQTPATAALPTSPRPTYPSAAATISPLRSLSDEEKSWRLILAAKAGAEEDVGALLAAGADVGASDRNDRTALHWAAINGHVGAARRLLEAGADVEAGDRWQLTPLHCAAISGDVAVVRLLVAASADPDDRDEKGRTPLHWAATTDNSEAAAALLEAGASKWVRDEDGRTPLDEARLWENRDIIQVLSES